MHDDERRVLAVFGWCQSVGAAWFSDNLDGLTRCLARGWVRALEQPGGTHYERTPMGAEAFAAAGEPQDPEVRGLVLLAAEVGL